MAARPIRYQFETPLLFEPRQISKFIAGSGGKDASSIFQGEVTPRRAGFWNAIDDGFRVFAQHLLRVSQTGMGLGGAAGEVSYRDRPARCDKLFVEFFEKDIAAQFRAQARRDALFEKADDRVAIPGFCPEVAL